MKRLALVACLLLPVTACNSATKATPVNYLNTLNAWLPDHPSCLLDGSIRFPYETSDVTKTRQMDALVAAQVLEVTHEPAIHISRYTLTPVGLRATSNLCYGHRQASAIMGSTPPAMANGFTETQVVYRYTILDRPIWAKTPDVVAEFPAMAKEVSGEATAKATLALTRVGWSVPD